MIKLTLEVTQVTAGAADLIRDMCTDLMRQKPISVPGKFRVEAITQSVTGGIIVTMCDEASYER